MLAIVAWRRLCGQRLGGQREETADVCGDARHVRELIFWQPDQQQQQQERNTGQVSDSSWNRQRYASQARGRNQPASLLPSPGKYPPEVYVEAFP